MERFEINSKFSNKKPGWILKYRRWYYRDEKTDTKLKKTWSIKKIKTRTNINFIL